MNIWNDLNTSKGISITKVRRFHGRYLYNRILHPKIVYLYWTRVLAVSVNEKYSHWSLITIRMITNIVVSTVPVDGLTRLVATICRHND